MSPAGTGGLAKVRVEACAQQHAMEPTTTPGKGEIMDFFKGRAIYLYVSSIIISNNLWGLFHNTIILTLPSIPTR